MINKNNNTFRIKGLLTVLAVMVAVLLCTAGRAEALTRVRDIARPLGERTNKLWSLGVVFGLNGKGDGGNVLITARPLMTMLQKMGNPPSSIEELKDAKNVALVVVTADLPRNGVRNGDEITVTVSCIGKASNLAGGTLVMTPLRGSNSTDTTLYAWAQGAVTVPDAENSTTGIVKNGAVMEVDFIHGFVDKDTNGRTYFDLVLDEDQAGWQAAYTVAMFIDDMNSAPGAVQGESYVETDIGDTRTAEAIDPRNIRVYIPDKQSVNPAGFISRVMSLVVDLPDPEATIVVHEKTMTIAITGNVEIAPCSVTVDGLMIRIDPQPQPQQTQWSKFDTINEGTAKLDDLINALEQLNVSVQQKIDAIYALRDAGVLRARIKTN